MLRDSAVSLTSCLTVKKAAYPMVLAAVLLTIVPVFANDTTAELATGGLIFAKSNDIEMKSEDLFISMKEIRVQYRFFNHANKNIVAQIAFPVPDLPYDTDDFNFAIPTDDAQNILGFSTTVNNQPIATLVERKALLDGVDKTEVLEKLGVPIAPQLDKRYDYLSDSTWGQLIRLGLIKDTPKSDGYIQPRWTLKTTYYWEQTFPARQEVTIVHRYLPSVGGVVPLAASYLLKDPQTLQIDRSKGINRFCIDQALLNAMLKRPNSMWSQHFLEYVLITGANWSGPIKNFRVLIDKSSPDNLVSFCGHGVRKNTPTQFEYRLSNFTPTSNLSVLFLTPARSTPPSTSTLPGGERDVVSLSCDQLWYQRNSIVKAAGYCFHTPRAISTFGNARCAYDKLSEVPLSDRDHQVIDIIQQAERMKRCPR
jgi:hypothetical protein